MWRMNTSRIGNVTGSEFNNCYIGPVKKDGRQALIIYGVKIEDFVFTKDDIKEFSAIETGVVLVLDGKNYIGNKYKITFKNEKTALVSVPTNACKKIEAGLY